MRVLKKRCNCLSLNILSHLIYEMGKFENLQTCEDVASARDSSTLSNAAQFFSFKNNNVDILIAMTA